MQVIWMSKCHCKVNLCYFFKCERRPPSEEEMKTLKESIQEKKDEKKEKKVENVKDAKEDDQLSPRPTEQINLDDKL